MRHARLLLLIVATAAVAVSPALADGVNWMHDLAPAFAQASTGGKPVLVDVWAVWCAPCKEMDETTYRDDGVLEAFTGFVPLKIDADLKTSFIDRYRIDAYPTLLFLDGKGQEIVRWRGAITADQIVPLMEKVERGYGSYLEALERLQEPDAADTLVAYLDDVGNAGAAEDHLARAVKSLKKSEPARRQAIQLRIAEARLAGGEPRAACKLFRRLVDAATEKELQRTALRGAARACGPVSP